VATFENPIRPTNVMTNKMGDMHSPAWV